MPTPEPLEPPESSQPRENSVRLDRDNRIRILALRDAGCTYLQISQQLQITYRQVQYTCQSQQATPKKARGNPPKLSEADVDNVIEWITSSKCNRRKPYYKVVQELNLPIGKHALARALKKRGYTRCIALRKPVLSEKNKRERLTWALKHINWSINQWNQIL